MESVIYSCDYEMNTSFFSYYPSFAKPHFVRYIAIQSKNDQLTIINWILINAYNFCANELFVWTLDTIDNIMFILFKFLHKEKEISSPYYFEIFPKYFKLLLANLKYIVLFGPKFE